jgi:endonuclease/exonuclease/phosphatase family metal-dependent hydrolase
MMAVPSMSARLLVVVAASLLVVPGCSGVESAQDDPAERRGRAPVGGYTAQPARIYVDEDADDWEGLSVRHTDVGDGEGVDLERLWTAHSAHHLFLQLELGQAVNLQEGNDLTLYLDTDDNPTTGKKALGVGAELAWTFGERSGQVFRNGDEEGVSHADIGLTSLPTVRADRFEIALDRSARPGGTPLFPGDTLRIALSNDGDRLPDGDGGLGYVLSDATTALEAPSIDRPSASAVRLLSYNSVNNFERGRSAIFAANRQPSFRRIFEAVGPDVIAFQEIYEQTAAQTEEVAEGELGLSAEWAWAKRGRDLVLGSRFPVLDTHAIPGYDDYRSGAFLLDAEAALGSRLVVVNMHPPCCNAGPEDGEPSSNAQRQRVVDGVAAFLRDLKRGDGPFEVAPGTPIVVLGDMNFVGDAQQPRTLRTGAIVNTDRFGPAAAPDWDGSPLLDTTPQQVATPMHTTWIDAESSFPPGRLDYAYVTDHVLEVVHEFVLYTPALPDETLTARPLQAQDTNVASDHLPVVIDVKSR